ncbi:phospholipase effector Tle1 domain-containing protein [Alkalimarinus sediminis]|uniref:DUF2235 domain-containing protein n=1 Tax=Alkalimarinus sediminis TaxID=1632866 RepID=A0A9E8HVK2_9ALTE|nr:DUF2235 domain-containing protein [Alkalimarinus sediminis]UZW76574.1 DUF2235 domain-containing protein [Alkalimarinus sediminis]
MNGLQKRIVICCDGTWNKPDSEPTNVVKLARGVLPFANNCHQVVFYDQGVGTEGFFDKYIGGAFGVGVAKNILDAYRFIVHNYQLGDEIYCFGFSRGAYTVRALGGLLNTIGLLPKSQLEQLPDAYAYYRTHPEKRDTNIYSDNLRPDIKMMGVWDTVGALGSPTPFVGKIAKRRWIGFFDTSISSYIKNAFHALALDEKRQPFKADLWTGAINDDQCVEQRWFPGVHSNIGGGYDDVGLSDLALFWMIGKAEQLDLGFDPSFIQALQPHFNGLLYDSFSSIYHLFENINKTSGIRAIDGEADNPPINVRIDHSVYLRANIVADYEPENLLDKHIEQEFHYTMAVQHRAYNRQDTPGLVAEVEFGEASSSCEVVNMSEGGLQLIYDGDISGPVKVKSSKFDTKVAEIAWHRKNQYGLKFAA